MAILKRTSKPAAKTAATEPKKAKAKKAVEKTPVVEVSAAPVSAKAAAFALTLVSPRVSEKAAILATRGTYVFNVPVTANKVEIRKAVEAWYKVKVTDVRTIRGIGKFVRRGRTEGARNRWKKALVTVKPGQKIDLYEGV